MNRSKSSTAIQFFRGIDEKVVPEIRLTRSQDGKTGRAFFTFEKPEALTSENVLEIKGMIMVDEEGELVTRDVNARFVNGQPNALEVIFTWKTEGDFERFMRFAQRYAKDKGLGYEQNSKKG